jgi:oligopeptide transport system ATP-binding protein
MTPVLHIENLQVRFATPDGVIEAVRDVDFSVAPGEFVGIVGESGSGKSQMLLAVLGLLARNGTATGRVRVEGVELSQDDEDALNRVRGARIGTIFQDPMTSLTPHLTIGKQLAEVLEVHRGIAHAEARLRSIAMLERVHIGAAQTRIDQYPHQLSGGMRQRVMVAMALACDPALVVADEPTTALDVTIQAQILALFQDLRRDSQLAMVLITHDFGVVADVCDRVVVMYAGRIVEAAATRDIFRTPCHPYTEGLLAAAPRLDDEVAGPMRAIAGQPPSAYVDVPGCSFAERCPRASDRCRRERPRLLDSGGGRSVACHHPLTEVRA